MRVLVIDNYDSFTWNLVQYLGELGASSHVVKNDEIDEAAVAKTDCSGVRLGHQSIGQAFGGKVVRADRLMHGRVSPILHGNEGVFAGLPMPFEATRYHSLIVERASLPDCLEITAWTAEGEIMGLRHKTRPVEGVQFHPESVLTTHGKELLANWVKTL